MLGTTSKKLILSKLIHPFGLCFTIIPLLLSIFSLLGCYNVSQTSTYLVEYYFNEQSPLYKLIQTANSTTPQTRGLQKIKVKTGYMGICIDNIPDQLASNISSSVCYPRKNVTHTSSPLYTDLTIKLSSDQNDNDNNSTTIPGRSSDLQLNLLQMAQITAVDITHPYLLTITIILALTLLLTILYNRIPLLPHKQHIQGASKVLGLIVVLVCGMSCIWTHIGVKATFELVPRASFGVLGVRQGNKALVMGWVSFTFYVFVCVWLWFDCGGKREEEEEVVLCGSSSSIESSSFESKV